MFYMCIFAAIALHIMRYIRVAPELHPSEPTRVSSSANESSRNSLKLTSPKTSSHNQSTPNSPIPLLVSAQVGTFHLNLLRNTSHAAKELLIAELLGECHSGSPGVPKDIRQQGASKSTSPNKKLQKACLFILFKKNLTISVANGVGRWEFLCSRHHIQHLFSAKVGTFTATALLQHHMLELEGQKWHKNRKKTTHKN